ncbi:MAG: YceI family protein [Ferruginibacter sp.]
MKTILFLIAILVCYMATAQKVYTKNGSISFFSKAPLENISADNNQVTSVLTIPSGDLQFSVLIKTFHFKKSLMEQHFNENYLESDKYPKAVFKGKITESSKINFTTDDIYPVEVAGDLTIHGVTNKVTAPGTFTVKSGVVTGTSKLQVKLADYKISIPKIVKDNISEVVDISISCVYDQKM